MLLICCYCLYTIDTLKHDKFHDGADICGDSCVGFDWRKTFVCGSNHYPIWNYWDHHDNYALVVYVPRDRKRSNLFKAGRRPFRKPVFLSRHRPCSLIVRPRCSDLLYNTADRNSNPIGIVPLRHWNTVFGGDFHLLPVLGAIRLDALFSIK